MGRTKGLIPFSGNFEPKSAEPFDGRSRVENKSDLTLQSTWVNADGNVYLYREIVVSVYNDLNLDNRGLYRLIADDYTNIENWVKIGGDYVSDVTITTGVTYNIDGKSSFIGVSGTTATINLPSTPKNYFEVTILDLSGDADTNNITINGNGKAINNDNSVIINTDFGYVHMKYITDKWYILNLG